MGEINSFKTKRGSAALKEDAIEFSGSAVGYYKSIYREYWKSESVKLKSIFLLIVLSFPSAFYAILSVLSMDGGYSIVALIFMMFILILAIQYLRGFRSPDRIQLGSIENVSYTRGKKLITRPRFVIEYAKNGSTYKRRVNMPSLYTESAEEELELAKKAFRQRGFL